VLVVCAHPDDESFGLGAVISTLVDAGVEVRELCLTHGEMSTLGAVATDLAVTRAGELQRAAAVLGVRSVELRSYPDGGLSTTSLDELCREVQAAASSNSIDCLVVFDEGGITGHPDHQRATQAAMTVARRIGVPVLAWTIPHAVAVALNEEFGAGFIGRNEAAIDFEIVVDRRVQYDAIACHASQSIENPVLWRRLALQGSREFLRWMIAPGSVT
jgi:LmbE family N-acetylglucosaminyl deacetylase